MTMETMINSDSHMAASIQVFKSCSAPAESLLQLPQKALSVDYSEHVEIHNKRADISIHPRDLASLYQLHEEWELEHKKTKSLVNIDAEVKWGQSDSWLVHGVLPKSSEKPFTVRELCLLPKVVEKPQDLLRALDVSVLGMKGKKKEVDQSLGQDNFSVSCLANDWRAYCVMDGHGPDGHWPAAHAVLKLPQYLSGRSCSKMLRQREIPAALKFAFEKVQQDLQHSCGAKQINLFLSGSTATCALHHPRENSIWVATAGDSRAILVSLDRGLVSETQDHHPTCEQEVLRIESAGGEVRSKVHANEHVETRVYQEGRPYPGLLMTRSLGDMAAKVVGVICEPEVVEWSLLGLENPHYFAASDGVWEFMPSMEVADLLVDGLKNGVSGGEVVQRIVELAKSRWHDEEEHYCDDITVVLVPLTSAPSPKAHVREATCCLPNLW